MLYVAKFHVTLGGREYLPGEVIDGPVPSWWLGIGAAEKIGDGTEDGAIPSSELVPGAFIHHPATPEPEDEIDQEAEPAEIDVSAGVVPAEEEVKPKRQRKNGGKAS